MQYHSIKDPIRIYNELLGGKWRLLIIYQLFQNTQRFKDLTANIVGITPRMLTKELRILEKYNLVEKEVYREVPPRVEYSLTDEGIKLYPLIESIIQFGQDFGHLTGTSQEDLKSQSIQRNHALRSESEPKKNTVTESLTTKETIMDDESAEYKDENMESKLEEVPTSLKSETMPNITNTDETYLDSEVRDVEIIQNTEQLAQEKESNIAVSMVEDVKEQPPVSYHVPVEQVKKKKDPKQKKLKISHNTNAIQLELF